MTRIRKDAQPGASEAALLRRRQALQYRIAGGSYRKIAEQLGVSHGQIARDITAELLPIRQEIGEKVEQLRAMEISRLDIALVAIVVQVQAGDLPAIDRWIRLSERRSRLLGLDAPVRHDVTSNGSQIASLAEVLALAPPTQVSNVQGAQGDPETPVQ